MTIIIIIIMIIITVTYRPITCLPLMWKLLTGMVAEETYNYLDREKLLPEEQKRAVNTKL